MFDAPSSLRTKCEMLEYILRFYCCFQDPREKLILSLKREIKILRNENVYLRQQVSKQLIIK